jgi:hypothetical protein
VLRILLFIVMLIAPDISDGASATLTPLWSASEPPAAR